MSNLDPKTVEGFGKEWSTFDQSQLDAAEKQSLFREYFALFPWDGLPEDAEGLDIGCGSGRWATLAAPRVGTLHLLDASADALEVARANLAGEPGCVFHHASVGALPFADASLDFAYSLGVLHHVPDTRAALAESARVLRPGAPLLVYLYYAFDNRPAWYRLLWKVSDLLRRAVCRAPHGLRYAISQAVAMYVYWPLARGARLLERAGRLPAAWPLAYYRHRSFYTMRTDALDRFATRLEKRFTRQQIQDMLQSAGFQDVVFSEGKPFWVALARRR